VATAAVLLQLTAVSLVNSDSARLPESNRKMANLLERLAAEANIHENEYLNAGRAAAMEQELVRLQRTGTLSLSPKQEVQFRMQMGREMLRSGRTERAIAEFERVRSMLEGLGEPDRHGTSYQLHRQLGISYLRLGEQENCIFHHSVDACILPIRGGGIHTLQRGSRSAIAEYSAMLAKRPDDLGSRWLVNLAYMTLGEYPDAVPQAWLIPPDAFESDYSISPFRDVAPACGLDVLGLSGGSIMEDFDNDGYADIMASSWGLRDQLRYFRSNGDGSFVEKTEIAALTGQVSGLNMTHADFDNDGDRDVLVLRGAWLKEEGLHPNSLLRNDGDNEGGREVSFTDVSEAAGILSFHPTHTAAWGDYDNDGWLDLYVGNETVEGVYGETPRYPHPNQLFRSNRDGSFRDVAPELAVDFLTYAKGVGWGDYDNDGQIDLYVSALGSDNILMHNRIETSGEFSDVTAQAGVAEPSKSFPTWFWDYDNDGWQDLFVAGFDIRNAGDIADMYLGNPSGVERPRLYRNLGDGTFADVTRDAGMHDILIAMAANFGDIDNDGYLDCYIGNGHPRLSALVPNSMLRNAAGERFQDVSSSGGFGHLQKGHGISFGDIDNDGDQDIHQVMGGAFSGDLYQNLLFENPGNDNHWIALQLTGVQSNRDGIGARISVRITEDGVSRRIHLTVGTGGSFGSSTLQQEIGLGRAGFIDELEILWPATGVRQTFVDLKVDQFLGIVEGEAEAEPLERRRFKLAGADGSHHN